VNLIFVLRALAAQKLLQQRKSLRRCAAGKPVIHASRSGNETFKDQVADEAPFCCVLANVSIFRIRAASSSRSSGSSSLC
jgi:hypothetical protein